HAYALASILQHAVAGRRCCQCWAHDGANWLAAHVPRCAGPPVSTICPADRLLSVATFHSHQPQPGGAANGREALWVHARLLRNANVRAPTDSVLSREPWPGFGAHSACLALLLRQQRPTTHVLAHSQPPHVIALCAMLAGHNKLLACAHAPAHAGQPAHILL
ncbi:hypothetical protein GGI06_005949, partial [Coemansia sp. S85]